MLKFEVGGDKATLPADQAPTADADKEEKDKDDVAKKEE